MKNLKLILISVWVFTSCMDTEFQRQYVSDLVLVTKAINGDTLVAIDGYITTNDNADSVRVSGKTFLGFNKLFKAYEGNSQFFEYSTPDSAYSKIVPVTSDYTFTIYHSDKTVEYQYDRLSTQTIKPATIDSVRFDTKFEQVDLYWRKVEGAESYMVQFFRNGEMVYRSPNLIPSLRLFSVNQSSSVQWYKTVAKGDTLQVRLVAIAFEDEYKASDNYQAMSFSGFSDIVWGVKK